MLLDYPNGFVEINPEDAKQFGLRDGERVRLRGPNGTAVSTARVTPEVRRGVVYAPHFVREVEQQMAGGAGGGESSLPVRLEKEAP